MEQSLLATVVDLRLRIAATQALLRMAAIRPPADWNAFLRRMHDELDTPPAAGAATAAARAKAPTLRPRGVTTDLTDRQVHVIHLLAHGHTNAAAGEQLHLAPTTVKRHLEDIALKLGVRDRAGIVGEAYRRRILTVPN